MSASRLVRDENIIARQIAGEHLLVPVRQTGADIHKVYALNETAAAVWRLLEAPRTEDELVAELVAEFEADRETIVGDARPFLNELIEAGFVRVLADG